jgi:hypothetical protein
MGESLEAYYIPVSLSDLEAIQDIIQQHEIVCAPVSGVDLYKCLTWRREGAHYGTEVHALFDRNILSDVLQLAHSALGQSEACGERGRVGAALMAFLQCSNITIEPNMALYENAPRANAELSLFRRADDVDPTIYTDIALDRMNSMPPDALPALDKPIPQVNFSMAIKGRRNLRIATLKIAEIELLDLPAVQKMERFLRWSFSDFCLLAGPVLLAAAYFTPRREGSILKNLRNADRQKALAAVSNAVWDLQMIYHWAKRAGRQREENSFWLFCSRDRALKQIARAFLCSADESSEVELGLREFFETTWGTRDGAHLAALTLAFQREKNSPERMANSSAPNDYPDQLAAQLESSLLAWRPSTDSHG